MSNRALRSRIVEFEKDAGMSGVHEEDLESVQKKCVEVISVVNLDQDELRVRHREEKSVSTELEKNTTEINETNQANVEVPSIKSLQAMLNSMFASLKTDQEEMIATLQESLKVRFRLCK
jgi:hypothetical protein